MSDGPSKASRSPVARLVRLVGRSAAWLTLAMVLVTFAMVTLRYGFSMGWVWLQESVSFLHATVFMLAIAWTLQVDAHVRVDIFYRDAGPRRQALVNLAGTGLFLAPFCLFLIIVGWDYVAASWGMREASREAGGLPGVFLLKSLIIAMPALLLLQALDDAWRDIRLLRSRSA